MAKRVHLYHSWNDGELRSARPVSSPPSVDRQTPNDRQVSVRDECGLNGKDGVGKRTWSHPRSMTAISPRPPGPADLLRLHIGHSGEQVAARIGIFSTNITTNRRGRQFGSFQERNTVHRPYSRHACRRDLLRRSHRVGENLATTSDIFEIHGNALAGRYHKRIRLLHVRLGASQPDGASGLSPIRSAWASAAHVSKRT